MYNIIPEYSYAEDPDAKDNKTQSDEKEEATRSKQINQDK